MISPLERTGALRLAAPHHEAYFLDVPRAPGAKDISIPRFSGVEAIGEARRLNIAFTHPLADLRRADYLGRPATLTLQPVNPDEMSLSERGCARRADAAVETKEGVWQ
ncbi:MULTISPECIES: hypothetical protein [unclassified Caballeronia]|uniref:hypothetical protein n=1 Tax=unclassified Caballeronia TaxID=2646786 RepID=UPI0028675EE3|nr:MULTISPECIES: hypothetical protein [unclassified Caballeronia]MDR5750071.1 hypothetical protein [Caballeronia sp. LZ024]MDR5842801.1 hypothetical protein [Caballeronia sp. LZ031]